jgi:hypothetical protein
MTAKLKAYAVNERGHVLYVLICIISYIVSPESVVCYYIQPGRTIGYQRDVNLPALQLGIRLSQISAFVCISQGI